MAQGILQQKGFSETELVSANTDITLSEWSEAIIFIAIGGSSQAFTGTVIKGMIGSGIALHIGATTDSNTGASNASVIVNGNIFALTSCYWVGLDRTSDSKMKIFYR